MVARILVIARSNSSGGCSGYPGRHNTTILASTMDHYTLCIPHLPVVGNVVDIVEY
jgi:hypothetical protein